MSAKNIFDKAVGINAGETLMVPCHDFRQQESMRVALAHQRRYFLDKSNANFDILVHKKIHDGKPYISISKVPRITTGFIISKDGEVKTTSLEPEPEDNSVTSGIIELARIRAAMKEDGYTEEQIDEYLAGEDAKKMSIVDTSGVCLKPEELEK